MQILDAPDVPVWATAGRPGSPNSGYMGFNSTLGKLEVFDGSTWVTWPTPSGSGISLVSSLPGSPADGAECYYQSAAMVTAGMPPWHLRYRSGSSSSYKWEVIAGRAIRADVATSESVGSASFTNLTTTGPTIALPLAGDYDVEIGARMTAPSGLIAAMSYSIGATAAANADEMILDRTSGGNPSTTHRSMLKTGLSAVNLQAKYRTGGASVGVWEARYIKATPLRVG